jgi:hypothetical protein
MQKNNYLLDYCVCWEQIFRKFAKYCVTIFIRDSFNSFGDFCVLIVKGSFFLGHLMIGNWTVLGMKNHWFFMGFFVILALNIFNKFMRLKLQDPIKFPPKK